LLRAIGRFIKDLVPGGHADDFSTEDGHSNDDENAYNENHDTAEGNIGFGGSSGGGGGTGGFGDQPWATCNDCYRKTGDRCTLSEDPEHEPTGWEWNYNCYSLWPFFVESTPCAQPLPTCEEPASNPGNNRELRGLWG
jgi:hypothetical protein